MKSGLIFVLHLFNATIATLSAAVFVRQLYMSVYPKITGHRAPITMEIQSFLPAILAVGIVAGYLTFSRMGGKSAFWIFSIPTTILFIRILTFPPASPFDSGIASGWRYFFGVVKCSSNNLGGLAYTASQCVNRALYIGAICSSLGYSAGSVFANMRIWPSRIQQRQDENVDSTR